MKYEKWLNEWLDNYVKIASKHRTIERYTEIVNQHLIPSIGDYELQELTPILLQKYVTELLEHGNKRTGQGLAASSVNSIITVIQSSLHIAYNLGYIDDFEIEDEKPVVQAENSEAQVIEPEIINNTSIYRVYLSASNGIKKYRDTFRKTILNEGDLVIETCGEINASKIMGRISVADAVLIAIDDKDIPIPNHFCNKCPLSGSCIKVGEKVPQVKFTF